jgi:hypothetical protein
MVGHTYNSSTWKFKTSLGYIVRLCLKKKNHKGCFGTSPGTQWSPISSVSQEVDGGPTSEKVRKKIME